MSETFDPVRVLELQRQFEMTERVAKAMFLAEHLNAKWSAGRVRMLWFTRAAAAIEALSEPTEAMLDAVTYVDAMPATKRAIWREMIDAAKFPWGVEAP